MKPAEIRITNGRKAIEPYGFKHYTHKLDNPDKHDLALVPQSIADGWQGFCQCGEWSAFQSSWYLTRKQTIDRIKSAHKKHVCEVSNHEN